MEVGDYKNCKIYPTAIARLQWQPWAISLARRELGEGLAAIALDLGMPYEMVKTYVKLARRALV